MLDRLRKGLRVKGKRKERERWIDVLNLFCVSLGGCGSEGVMRKGVHLRAYTDTFGEGGVGILGERVKRDGMPEG